MKNTADRTKKIDVSGIPKMAIQLVSDELRAAGWTTKIETNEISKVSFLFMHPAADD